MLDNSHIIADFCPAKDDGDTFIYTEMLDRGAQKGNNKNCIVKTFYHRSVDEFWEQLPVIKNLCDSAKVRACTRLAPRSYKKVGANFTKLVVEAALTDNFAGMKSLYNKACGTTAPIKKLWLFDVDVMDWNLHGRINEYLVRDLKDYVIVVPSRKGIHIITPPFQVKPDFAQFLELNKVTIHKDNPTNLYIPDGAA